MKKALTIGGTGLLLLAALFVPLSETEKPHIISNLSEIGVNETNPYNFTLTDVFEIKANQRIDDEIDIYSMENLLRENFDNIYRVKEVYFPEYDVGQYPIEIYENQGDRICNFNYPLKIEYYLIDDPEMKTIELNVTGQVIFRYGDLDYPEIFTKYNF